MRENPFRERRFSSPRSGTDNRHSFFEKLWIYLQVVLKYRNRIKLLCCHFYFRSRKPQRLWLQREKQWLNRR